MSQTAIDVTALNDLLGRAVVDLGAVPSAGLVTLGARLGLFAALAEGPRTSEALAAATDTDERYVREWARALAAGGYVTHDPAADTYTLSPEQAAVLSPGGMLDLPAAFEMWVVEIASLDRAEAAFRSGEGFAWGDHDERIHRGTDAFYRSGYEQNLVAAWLPAVEGLVERLRAGGRVADVGTGYGSAPILVAQAFPDVEVVGFDGHAPSVEAARSAARDAGLEDRVHFEVADAASFGGGPYDLVTTFDALHDMGDPVATARCVAEQLGPDGVWLVVEPVAGESVTENLHPVGRLYYSVSSLLCVPHARSEGGDGLGAQAGESTLREVAAAAGLSSVRRAAQTPFNAVYEIRR